MALREGADRFAARMTDARGIEARHLAGMRREQALAGAVVEGLDVFGEQVESIGIHDGRTKRTLDQAQNFVAMRAPETGADRENIEMIVRDIEARIDALHHHLRAPSTSHPRDGGPQCLSAMGAFFLGGTHHVSEASPCRGLRE